MTPATAAVDAHFMRLALRLAQRGYGRTSPNPMVGAVLVRRGRVIGQGWHSRAGEPHAEIEALRDAERRGESPRGTTLYVTLEPCCTTGRTPPCTEAIIRAGIGRVVVAATDPNPNHAGRGFEVLRQAGVKVEHGLLAERAARLNEAFNHWIVRHTPFVTVKAAMTLDGKIATAAGESKWITGEAARHHAMRLRLGADALLVGVNTVRADNPRLTVRASLPAASRTPKSRGSSESAARRRMAEPPVPGREAPAAGLAIKPVRRLVLDARARTPLDSRLVTDAWAGWTTVFVGEAAPVRRRTALAQRVRVVVVPESTGRVAGGAPQESRPSGSRERPRLDLRWILSLLGRENVTSLLVEGGSEVNASFFEHGLVQRVAFYFAPKVLGEAAGRRAVGGEGFPDWSAIPRLNACEWRAIGSDLFLTARVGPSA